MKFIASTSINYSKELYADLLRYRYRVFVGELGWQVPHYDGMEFDQFDRDDTLNVAACDEQGRIVGCSRLLPTTRPYLLDQVFPQLMDGQELPHSDEVWELSRFSARNFEAVEGSSRHSHFSPTAINVLKHSLRAVAERGAKRLICVTSVEVASLGLKSALKVRRASAPMTIDGHRVLACWIDV